jgi:hypothetical protein
MERLFDPAKPHFAAWVWLYEIDYHWILPRAMAPPRAPWRTTFLVDGILAHMFGPEDAALYFARLLKVDVRSLHPMMSQEWPHAFFIASPTVQNAAGAGAGAGAGASTPQDPILYIDRQPAQLLDYTIRQVGTVVPQGIWPPSNNNSNTLADTPARTAKAVPLNMPIFFAGMDRVSLGLPLYVAITEGDRVQLQSAGGPAPIGHGSTTYIRITVSIFSKEPRASILSLLVAGL